MDDATTTLTLHSIFYSLVNGESRVIRNSDIGNEQLELLFLEFRRMTSEFLYQTMARGLAPQLERDERNSL